MGYEKGAESENNLTVFNYKNQSWLIQFYVILSLNIF